MRSKLFGCFVLSFLFLTPIRAGATVDPQTLLNQEANTGVGAVASLLTAVDATLTDTAVTDAQLAGSGGIDDSLPAFSTRLDSSSSTTTGSNARMLSSRRSTKRWRLRRRAPPSGSALACTVSQS